MTDFNTRLEQLLAQIEADMTGAFGLHRDIMVQGRYVALEARFSMNGERKFLGLIPTGTATRCQENCVFIPTEHLTEQGLDALLQYITQLHDAVVRPDASHEFTMVSLVILTDEIDVHLQKKLKKFQHERQYQSPLADWSSTRVAVVELATNKVHCNAIGAALRDRLLQSIKKL